METQLMEKKIEENEVLSAEATKQLLADLGAKESLLNDYSKKAEAAAKAAEAALSIANQAKEDADSARNTATGELKVGFFNKKDAIIDVKGRVTKVAEALSKATSSQIDLAKAQTELARAQKVSLECQKKLAEISVAMVQLGCTSIANSRIVVRQLEARLEGASEEELNDLARAEIQNVVMQIRDQQDVLAQQEQLTRIVHGQEERLQENMRADSERDRAIMEQMQMGLERDRKIAAQARRNEEHHRVLAMQSKRNDEVARTLKQHEKIAQSLQESVSLNANRVQTHSQLLEQNVQVVKALDERILINTVNIQDQAAQIIQLKKKAGGNEAAWRNQAQKLENLEEKLVQQDSHIASIEASVNQISNTVDTIIADNAWRDTTIADHHTRVEYLETQIVEKDQEIKALQEQLDNLQSVLLAKADRLWIWILGGAGAVSIILSILHFFI